MCHTQFGQQGDQHGWVLIVMIWNLGTTMLYF